MKLRPLKERADVEAVSVNDVAFEMRMAPRAGLLLFFFAAFSLFPVPATAMHALYTSFFPWDLISTFDSSN